MGPKEGCQAHWEIHSRMSAVLRRTEEGHGEEDDLGRLLQARPSLQSRETTNRLSFLFDLQENDDVIYLFHKTKGTELERI